MQELPREVILAHKKAASIAQRVNATRNNEWLP